MERAGSTDVQDWARLWVDTYRALGGKSRTSGAKGCPRAAAYALWLLGRLRCGHRDFQSPSIAEIQAQIGKNAAYAMIAVDLLSSGVGVAFPKIWETVQERYKKATGQEPATSEQGEVRLVTILFADNQIVIGKTPV